MSRTRTEYLQGLTKKWQTDVRVRSLHKTIKCPIVKSNEIAATLAQQVQIDPRDMKKIVTLFLFEMEEKLRTGYAVNLNGMGIFYPAMRKAFTSKSFTNGHLIHVGPRRIIKFRSTWKFRRRINGLTDTEKAHVIIEKDVVKKVDAMAIARKEKFRMIDNGLL